MLDQKEMLMALMQRNHPFDAFERLIAASALTPLARVHGESCTYSFNNAEAFFKHATDFLWQFNTTDKNCTVLTHNQSVIRGFFSIYGQYVGYICISISRQHSTDICTANVDFRGPSEVCDFIKSMMDNYGAVIAKYVNIYVYDKARGTMSTNTTLVDQTHVGRDSFYPSLELPLLEYINKFLKSKSALLLLIGPPGTGKSTFMRTLLLESDRCCALAYGDNARPDTGLLNSFFFGENNMLFIEDADVLLMPRTDGNSTMSELLNGTDGIAYNDKKIVISTNLETTAHIDEALLRSGRCFGVVTFDLLTRDEAANVLSDLGRGDEAVRLEPNKLYSLADTLSPMIVSGATPKKFGFAITPVHRPALETLG